MAKIITVITANDIPTAEIYKSHLESEGIKCSIENKDVVAANPLLAVAVGGIKVNVREEDAERAKELLKIEKISD